MRIVEYRRNSLSTTWTRADWEGVTIESVAELNQAHGWFKFRVTEVPDDQAESAPETAGTLP